MTRAEIQAQLPDHAAVVACLFGEARGEGVLGQIAVGAVIRNRVRAGARTWAQIVCAPYQFSCFNLAATDANTGRTYAVAEGLITGTLPPLEAGEAAIVKQLGWIATGLLSDEILDVVHGAQFYLTTDLLRTAPPSWTRAMHATVVIGAHTFLSPA